MTPQTAAILFNITLVMSFIAWGIVLIATSGRCFASGRAARPCDRS